MSSSSPSRAEVVDIAVRAGRNILKAYRRERSTSETKADGSPVTAVDRAADAEIRTALSARFGHPVLSEESVHPAALERQRWDAYWLVDPLDGTRDFLARTGDFTVNIALIVGDRPVLGVIAAPFLGRVWSARRGEGAFRHVLGREARITASHRPRSPIALVSRFHMRPALRDFLAKNGITELRRVGSAVKFGRMAEGAADIYARLSPTMEWDVAAGDCIVTEAGCTMTALDTGEPLRYNKADLVNPGFVVRAPRD